MPAQTDINIEIDPITGRRRRRRISLVGGEPGYNDALPGPLNLTGVQAGLESTVGALQPNLQIEETARISALERAAQLARERLGRQFAITPGGTTTPGLQSGGQQRRFETLESGVLSSADQIRADIAARTGTEQRANIATLAGLQGQGFTQGINLAGLGLQTRAQTEAERAAKAQETLQSRGVAVTEQSMAEEIRRNLAAEALQRQQLTGLVGTTPTLAARAQTEAETTGAYARGLATRQQTEAERAQLAEESLRGRGMIVTEQSLAEEVRRNQALETLQARGVTVTEGSLAEEVRRNQAAETLQARGVAVTEGSLAEEVRRNQAAETLQARGVTVTEGSLAEEVRRNQALETLQARGMTEEERRNLAAETLQARGVAVTEGSLAEEVRRNQAAETLQARGVAVTEGSLAEEVRRNQALETLQARGVTVTEGSLAEEVRRNQALETLQARGVAVTEGSLAEEIRRNQAVEALQSRGVTVTEQSLAEEVRRNQALETLQARGVAVTELGLQEEIRRNQAAEILQTRGVAVTEQSLAEEIRRNQAAEALQSRGIAVTEENLAEEIRQFDANQRFQEAAITGTLAGRSISTDDFARVAGIDLTTDPIVNLERLTKVAAAYGLIYDPTTLFFSAPGQETLQSQVQKEEVRRNQAAETLQARGVAVTEGSLAEEVRRNQALETLQARGVTVTEGSLAEEVRRNQAAETLQARGIAVTEGSLAEEVRRNQAAEALAAGAQTFAQAAEIARQTGKFIDPTTGTELDTLAKTQQSFDKTIQTAALTGNLYDPNTKTNLDTLAARALTLQAQEATGEVTVDGVTKQTLAQKSLDLQNDIQRGALELQTQAQAFGQTVTEAELTGYYDKMGTEWGSFQAAYNTTAGDAGFNARYDFDGDGNINFADYLQFAQVANNEPAETLAAQMLQEQKLTREFQEKVTNAGLMGTYEGQKTVAETQRTFDNRLAEAQLFVDTPPVTLSWTDYALAFNSKTGEPNYRKELDLDGDGNIQFSDFVNMMKSDRVEVVSGSIADPSKLVITYRPEGKITAIAAQLNMDERRLAESTRQFNEQVTTQNAQFLTNATGYLYDGNGNLQSKWNPATTSDLAFGQTATFQGNLMDVRGNAVTGQVTGTTTGMDDSGRWMIKTTDGRVLVVPDRGAYIAGPVSTLEQEQFAETKRQFNKQMDVNVEQFMEQLGLSKDQLEAGLKGDKWQAWATILSAGLGAVGQIKAGSSRSPLISGGATPGPIAPTVTSGNTGSILDFLFGRKKED